MIDKIDIFDKKRKGIMSIIESYFIEDAIIERGDYNILVIGSPYRICKLPIIKYLFAKRVDLRYPDGKIKTHKFKKIARNINNGWNLISALTGNRIN